MDFSTILQTPTFRALVQENALDRVFHDALYPKQLFREEFDSERWEANVGDNKTFTGKGLMKVKLRPLIPGQDPTPADYRLEQWFAQQQQYANTIDTNLPTAYAACVNKLTHDLSTLGLNAGQSLNRICRYKLYNAADSGWTVADGAQNTVTALRVKRLNGFTRARRPDLPAGSPVRYDFVTANNPLPITVGTTAVNVTGFTPDTAGDEIGTGTLTLDAAVTVADRAVVYASTRTFRVIAGGGLATDALTAGTDILTLATMRTLVARLRTTDVMEMSDGTYHMHVDPIGEGQLFSDAEFQQLMRGTAAVGTEGRAYRDFIITQIMGCTLYRNNECPTPNNVDGGSTATFSFDDPIAGEVWSNGSASTGAPVHRALMTGMEAGKEYYVDQNAMVTEAGVTGRIEKGARIVNNGVEIDVDRIRVVMRAPQDRLQQIVANTWSFQGDFVIRTDGATGDAASYKRVGAICFTE
jgi:hypothetical protein